jgi:hypothetical protein
LSEAAVGDLRHTGGPGTMLEEAERQVTELEAALQGPRPKSKIAVLPAVVETGLQRHLRPGH